MALGRGKGPGRVRTVALFVSVILAIFVIAFSTLRATLQLDKLGQEAVFEVSIGLAREKAKRLDQQIVEQDNVIFALADPERVSDLPDRWLPTAKRETPTVRAIVMLDATDTVVSLTSRVAGGYREDEAFRHLLVHRMLYDLDLGKLPYDELRHLHKQYDGQSYLISYWARNWQGRRYLIIAWHDLGRIIRETMPMLYAAEQTESDERPRPFNVVDEEGRLIFGPPVRSGEFTVSVQFPTTLYSWRIQVAPSAGEASVRSAQRRRVIEHAMVAIACIVLFAGLVTILAAAERERRISELKSDFVANVSHELKTPLALVRMFAEMLQSGRVTSEEKRAQYIDIILKESERLSGLIENVLDFSKAERGKSAYEFQEVDVHAMILTALDACRYRAEQDAVTLDLRLNPEVGATMGDPQALQVALVNLIDNALKYGGEAKRVYVSSRRVGKVIELCVADDGPGVKKEERQRVFERFFRGEAHRGKSGVRGSGIGLAHVQHIAESHGGRIRIVGDSTLPAWGDAPAVRPKGAIFVMTLPARPLASA